MLNDDINNILSKNKNRLRCDPGLYLVATPIGNLLDISLRALKTLESVDIIYCEDTRVSSKLLSAYGISNKLSSYHEHNAQKIRGQIIEQIKNGKSIALISDAGTPLINDPGYKLVSECYEHNLKVVSIPGPSAPIVALTIANMPSDRFLFAGFVESKQGARKKQFQSLIDLDATLIFFDSPKRILKTLYDLESVAGGSIMVSICRELSKKHEEVINNSLELVIKELESRENIKGEIVLLIDPRSIAGSGKGSDMDTIVKDIKQLIDNNYRVKDIATLISERYNKSKKEMYNLVLSIVDKK